MAFNPGMRELTREESDRRAKAGEPFVLRFSVPRDSRREVVVSDLVYGTVSKSTGDLEDFASHCDDAECRRALLATLQSADPPSEYRRVLLKYPKEEAHFFQFKERRARERAIEWLRENGIAK